MSLQQQRQQQQQPSLVRRISSYFCSWIPDHDASGTAASLATGLLSESSPLPYTTTTCTSYNTSCSSKSNQISNRLLSTRVATHVSDSRPPPGRSLTEAATSTETSLVAADLLSPLPGFPRPLISKAAFIGHPEHHPTDAMGDNRASFFTRATHILSNQLELNDASSYAHKNAPPAPSNWSDRGHRRGLLYLWDAVEEKAASSKHTFTITQRVVSTEKSMVHHFPELGLGERPLSREWIEYVLGVSLRHPFCTAENMGRWEILASSSGARGTWGPW